MKRARIELILGPAFSIYVNRPPLERECNRARNLQIYSELAREGIRVIPAVGFTNTVEARFTGAWVARLGLSDVFVDLQSTDGEWQLLRRLVPVFLQAARSLNRIVVNGVAAPVRIVELRELVHDLDLVLTNGNAFQLGESGHDYVRQPGGYYSKERSFASKRAIFETASRFYELAVASGCQTYRRAEWDAETWPRLGEGNGFGA